MTTDELLNFMEPYTDNPCEILESTWSEVKQALWNEEVRYDDLEQLMKYTFFKVFDEVFQNTYRHFEENLGNVNKLYRAAKGEWKTHSRFIPSLEYFNKDSEPNRFNPPGDKLFNYFATGTNTSLVSRTQINSLELTCIKEIRLPIGEEVSICQFNIEALAVGKRVFNLNVDACKDISDISDEYRRLITRGLRQPRGLTPLQQAQNVLVTSEVMASQLYSKFEIAKVIARLYFKLITRDLFLPVDGLDRNLEYAPFHAIACYFESKGYAGLLYPSTVYPSGENLVLFDISDAVPVGDIKHIIYNEE